MYVVLDRTQNALILTLAVFSDVADGTLADVIQGTRLVRRACAVVQAWILGARYPV